VTKAQPKKPRTPRPQELAADWDAIKKTPPPDALQTPQGYPDLTEDWATLKNLPQHAYHLEWKGSGDHLALHRLKVIAKRREGGWDGFVVAREKLLWADQNWKRTPGTPSRKGQWIRRTELCFTQLEVEREFMRYQTHHMNYAWQEIRRLRMMLDDMLPAFKYFEDMLLTLRGTNRFFDALHTVPKRPK
jgi:hypothetical protein